MSFLFFSPRKQHRQMEQLRREVFTQMQAGQQSIIDEIRQLSKGVETLHACIDRMHAPLAQLRPLVDALTRIQKEVETIPQQVSQLLPPTPPTVMYNGKLDEYNAGRIDTTKVAKTAAEQQIRAAQNWETERSAAEKGHAKEDKEFHAVLKNILPPAAEQGTEPIAKVTQDSGLNSA